MIVGCESDDKRSQGGPFTIITDIDFTTERGTFRVNRGSQELGCSAGTFVTHHLGQDEWSAFQKVLTCTEGKRSGSLLIRIELALARYRWNFQSGTGDFAGVKGKGKFRVRPNPGPELAGVET